MSSNLIIFNKNRNTKISLMDTVQLSGLLWPNFNKKEVVDIEIPTVEVGKQIIFRKKK